MSTALGNQTAAFKNETQEPINGIGAFVRIDMPGYTARLFTGAGALEWDDGTGEQTWLGSSLLDIQPMTATTRGEAQAVNISVSGIDEDIKEEVLSYLVRGSDVYVWFFYVNGSNEIVADPWLAFAGRVDVPQIEEGETITINVQCLDALGYAFRRTVSRRSNQDQQALFSGDVFFEFAASIAREPIRWGVPWENGTGSGSGGGGFGGLIGRVNNELARM